MGTRATVWARFPQVRVQPPSSLPSHRLQLHLQIAFEQIFEEELRGREQIINLLGAVTGLSMNMASYESLKQTVAETACCPGNLVFFFLVISQTTFPRLPCS